MENLNDIYGEIKSDPENAKYSAKNIDPLYYATKNARILIIGQAPGKKPRIRASSGTIAAEIACVTGSELTGTFFTNQAKSPFCRWTFISPELAGLVICRRARALPPNGIPVCSAPCRIFN